MRGRKKCTWATTGAKGDIKPLTDAEKAHYVIDPSKPGVMTKVSKLAFADRAKAEAVASAEASAKAGAKVVDFDAALKDAYLGMAEDTIMLRKRRTKQFVRRRRNRVHRSGVFPDVQILPGLSA